MESIFIHAMITILLPFGPLRAFFARLISLSHRRNLGQAMKMLQPVAEQRIQKRKSGDSKSNLNDGIEWTLNLTDEKAMEPYQLSLEILHNLFAGSLAPGAMVTELVFQAMMDPKLLEDLRTEARNATEKYGWTEKLLTNLPLQDSFIRELNRVFPTGSSM
jgi:cytochrome P450